MLWFDPASRGPRWYRPDSCRADPALTRVGYRPRYIINPGSGQRPASMAEFCKYTRIFKKD